MNTPVDIQLGSPLDGIAIDETKAASVESWRKARHDIRTAMHVVIGMSEVLAHSGGLATDETEIVNILGKNAHRALELIDNMFVSMEHKKEVGMAEVLSSSLPDDVEDGQAGKVPGLTALPQPQGRALVVEDYEANVFLVATFLKGLGYGCDVAKNGPEALEKFAAARYDVIIMDIQMPGMDGLEATRRIRALEKEKNLTPTPILASTGNATKDDLFFCTRAGMNDYISKPFSREQLGEKLLRLRPQFNGGLSETRAQSI